VSVTFLYGQARERNGIGGGWQAEKFALLVMVSIKDGQIFHLAAT
jgi:hypothetical protein